jgi:hypothetical protein
VSTRLPTPLSTILLPTNSVFCFNIVNQRGRANTILSSSLYWSAHGKNAFPHPFIAGQTPSLNCTNLIILISKKTANSYFSRQSAT